MKKNSGMTLIEVLMSVAILTIIIPIMVTLIDTAMKGMTGFDAQQQIKSANQKLINNIYGNLSSSKRIFQNSTSDNTFLARIILTGRPARLSGSKLPVILSTGTMSPSDAGFSRESVGNAIFFASIAESRQLLNVGGSTSTVTIDVYKFYHYYLTAEYKSTLKTAPSYNVYRFQSVSYADYNQLIAITNTTKRANAVKDLYSAGIIYGWDPSSTNVSAAFYTFSSAGAIALSAAHNIAADSSNSKLMISILTGQTGTGFGYGIPPNSSAWTKSPKTVPQYANAATNFPCGFEIAVVGSAGGRKVLVRSVIVAEGAMRVIPANDQSIVISAKDLW